MFSGNGATFRQEKCSLPQQLRNLVENKRFIGDDTQPSGTQPKPCRFVPSWNTSLSASSRSAKTGFSWTVTVHDHTLTEITLLRPAAMFRALNAISGLLKIRRKRAMRPNSDAACFPNRSGAR
jgi:hypothetical protein